jgi:hypothetical protein
MRGTVDLWSRIAGIEHVLQEERPDRVLWWALTTS